jgi:predicted alpha/beta-fold hydrolase
MLWLPLYGYNCCKQYHLFAAVLAMLDFDLPPFRPHPLLRSGHAQTLAGAYLPDGRRPYQASLCTVHLDDGDRLLLHDDCPADWQTGGRVALLLHGLGGSHESGYMVRIADKLNDCGVRTFRKDLRGFGAGYNMARHHCHAGRTDDAAACLDFVANLCPDSPVTVIGFSMSGNIVLKLLGDLGELAPPFLQGAVAVCPPIDLIHCASHLRIGMNRLYDWSFVRALHRLVHRRRRTVPDLVDRQLRPLPKRLREFDDQYTAPLTGFSGATEYYSLCSSGPHLSRIRVPTLIIAAADDPVIPVDMFERYAISSSVTLHITSHGGHLGFIGVSGVDADRRWLDWRVVDWITHHAAATRAPAESSAA